VVLSLVKTGLLLALGLAAGALSANSQPLVVHEWGTFTSLQDETGQALGGINTDDEPVPSFCHDLDPSFVTPASRLVGSGPKGIPNCHPDVTMRLETPVLYFHLPPDTAGPITASVKVAFHGGWLTQFYPAAETSGFARFSRLTPDSNSTLAWNDLQLGVSANGPATTEQVWTAPRAVAAASVTATNQESERFLFYRGVAHLLAPLQVCRSADAKTLQGRAQLDHRLQNCPPLSVRHLWLASFHADGTAAFRSLPPVTVSAPSGGQASPVLFSTPADFAARDYSSASLAQLRQQMHRALQEEGLFSDEADALLNTWELSYFKSPGLRLFFMVPQAWTDAYLPLDISVPCQVKRAMVGRLELVTPAHRGLLRQLAQAPVPTQPWAHYVIQNGQSVAEGAAPAAYRDLGRFRQALLLEEAQLRPSASLRAFIQLNRLESFSPPLAAADSAGLAQTR
jgi:hypothetical protein